MKNGIISARELTTGKYTRSYVEKKELMNLRRSLDKQIADLEKLLDTTYTSLILEYSEDKMRQLNVLNYKLTVLIERMKGKWLRGNAKYCCEEVRMQNFNN